MVKTAKNLMEKAGESGSDADLAMLVYRLIHTNQTGSAKPSRAAL